MYTGIYIETVLNIFVPGFGRLAAKITFWVLDSKSSEIRLRAFQFTGIYGTHPAHRDSAGKWSNWEPQVLMTHQNI